MKTWLRPLSYERRYGRVLRKTFAQMRKELLIRLRGYSSLDGNAVSTIVSDLDYFWQQKKPELQDESNAFFAWVNQYNDDQFRLVVRSITGLTLPASMYLAYAPGQLVSPVQDLIARFGEEADVYRQEPYLPELEENWKKTQQVYTDKVASTVISDSEMAMRSVLSGVAAVGGLVGVLSKLFDAVDKRVNNAASDQIHSLDNALTMNRQIAIGANEYMWDTRKDERVRGNPNGLYPKAKPSHFHRQNHIYRWNSPPEGGHPGQAPGCRCSAVLRLPR